MRARHRLSKLLLRHGLRYEGSAWSERHRTWARPRAQGKRAPVVTVAVARALAGFCWAITTIEEQEH
jgi:hypothetical protein